MSRIIIIPARLKSTRFPRKMLTPLAGRSVIQRTYLAACEVAGVDAVYVATDSEEIAENVRQIGAEVIMTDEDLRNGTERVAQAVERMATKPDLVINFQGDAPLTPPSFAERLIEASRENTTAEMLTPVLRCTPQTLAAFREDRRNDRVGATTAVFDASGRALYFSKEVIPYGASENDDEIAVFHHVGLYAYRPAALERYINLPLGRLERLEGLEQLRFLEYGMHVQTIEVEAAGREFWEVNNPEDIDRVAALLAPTEALRAGPAS